MYFIHKYNFTNDTIAAVATPAGEGAISIIRISGKNALTVGNKIFSKDVKKIPSHSVRYGKILTSSGEVIDHVLLLVMRAPRTYSGEDTVEIHCHGGSYITKAVLEAALKAGARAAQPGEFTFRAFRNGKLDLAQAEAVQSLISAKNKTSLKASKDQLEGVLSKKIQTFQEDLIDIGAILEAWVDFPEEDLEFEHFDVVIEKLKNIQGEIQKLIDTFEEGRKMQEGLTVCLIGAPNVGKSSLMNLLLKKQRSIVSNIAGTTRDTVEEDCIFYGLNLRLIDTAGIRKTEETIEKQGVIRSMAAMKQADVVLFMLDASREIAEEEKQILQKLDRKTTIVLQNKCDIQEPKQISYPHVFSISVKKQIGLDKLYHALMKTISSENIDKSDVVLTQLRHKEALVNAIQFCEKVIHGLKNKISAEFVSFDMRQMLKELGTIIGMDITEEILTSIFSKFCLGK